MQERKPKRKICDLRPGEMWRSVKFIVMPPALILTGMLVAYLFQWMSARNLVAEFSTANCTLGGTVVESTIKSGCGTITNYEFRMTATFDAVNGSHYENQHVCYYGNVCYESEDGCVACLYTGWSLDHCNNYISKDINAYPIDGGVVECKYLTNDPSIVTLDVSVDIILDSSPFPLLLLFEIFSAATLLAFSPLVGFFLCSWLKFRGKERSGLYARVNEDDEQVGT